LPSLEGPGRDTRIHLGEAAVVAAVALFCLVFQLRLPTQLPTDADFAAVKDVLEKEGQPGDAVLLYPWWTEHARLVVPESIPVVGYQGSDEDPLPRNARIWVLAQPNLPRANFSAFIKVFSPKRTPQGEARQFGNLSLQRFENGHFQQPLLTASDAVGRLQVYWESPGGERRPCGFDGRIHRCPQGHVAAEWHETKFKPRRCLRFYPPGGPAKLVAELSGVPQAAAASLEAGFIWDRGAFHDRPLSVTHFTLEVVGGETRTLDIPPRLETEQRVSMGAVPAGSTVRMTVQADLAELREFCADFVLWGKAP
jgi:hypothetical protein